MPKRLYLLDKVLCKNLDQTDAYDIVCVHARRPLQAMQAAMWGVNMSHPKFLMCTTDSKRSHKAHSCVILQAGPISSAQHASLEATMQQLHLQHHSPHNAQHQQPLLMVNMKCIVLQ